MLDELIEIIVHTDDALLALVAENILFAYSLLFLIIMLETGFIVFPFLPGDGLLFSAGVVAASTDLNVWILLISLMIAATLGNMANYYIGNLLGDKFKQSDNYFVKNWLIKHLPKAQEFYDKHGERAIIFGRFLPIVRTYIPFLAGVVKMEKQLFIKNTIFGAVAWISIFLLLGFFIGEIAWVKNNYGLIFIGLIIITLLPLLFSLLKKFKN
ncbi:VTT domain-containing protein [Confluentibacter flavum]|uniref:VTT domain-containing protein n=1 Tax=Confluentibacter flavum TaxID=1909700 RepID=A0A2N3HFE6_9FLAO|nr:VTT domain-containing protein [Confluentibacter flavum]PKQ43700.1 hypothetical protein CSW08_17000 [Confluentibacter flavum]